MVEEAGGLGALVAREGAGRRPSPSPLLDFVLPPRLALTFLDPLGRAAVAGDRHIAEFVPWVLTEESGWGSACNVGLTDIATRLRPTRRVTSPTSTPVGRHEAAADVVLRGSARLWSSTRFVTGEAARPPVNIPNAGQCTGPARGRSVVESICVVDDRGVRGRDRATLPGPLAELVRRHGR